MKVVLDSNIIVAAYAARGLCSSLFELCLDRYEIIISDFILAEVGKALRKKVKLSEKDTAAIINYLKEFCVVSGYQELKEPICRDKNDNDIIALAVGTGTGYIISGDDDLLVLKKYKNIKILSPREFWSKISGGEKA